MPYIAKNINTKDVLEERASNLFSAFELKKSDKLPNQHDACRVLGISRSAYREVISCLIFSGNIISFHGKPSVVKKVFKK